MAHHNFDSKAAEHLDSIEELKGKLENLTPVEDFEKTYRRELIKGMKDLTEKTEIPEDIKKRMKDDRAEAEAASE